MPVPRIRAVAASAIAVAIAVRVTAAQPVDGPYARIASDPGAALLGAADGWSASGTLGHASAQGLREIPLSAFLWVTDVLGVPPAGGRSAWCAVVLVLALVGAARLARTTQPSDGGDAVPWTSWVAALLFACSPVVVASALHAPGDALVAAVLPWVMVPLRRHEAGWRAAARSAAWLGLAGAGSPVWAVAALLVGAATAVAASRRRGGGARLVRWAALAAAASAWWVCALVWESLHGTGLAALLSEDPTTRTAAEALLLPTTEATWVVLAAVGPVLVAVAALALRAPVDRLLVGALLALVLGGVATWVATGGELPAALLPSSTAEGTSIVPAPWLPVLSWVALFGLVSWCPLVERLLAGLP